MPESPDSMYFSFFMLENTWYHNFTRRGANSQEIVNAVSIMGPPGSKLYWNKVHNFLQILSTSSKIMAYVFWHENGEIHGIWAFCNFSSKSGCQKYIGWVPGVPFYKYDED